MNFRILAAQALPRGRAFAAVAAGTILAAVTVSSSFAQAPAPAAPKAPKAAPAPKAAAPAAAGAAAPAAPAAGEQQQVQLIYQPWAKYCMKGQESTSKEVCFIGKDGRIESGQTVVAAVLIEPKDDPKKLLRVTLPLGMALVQGTRVVIDQNAPQQSPFVACFQNGCMSDYELTPAMIATLKKGTTLFVQAIQVNGQAVTLPLPLQEFAKAYDGPPTDPKVFEENQKKLQEELQKRAAEARAKLEGASGATPAAK